MAHREVLVTGYGVRSAFGFGRGPLLDSVFAGVGAFRTVDRFDTSPYRASLAAIGDSWPSHREALAEVGRSALAMAGLAGSQPAAALVGTGGDHAPLTRFWRDRLACSAPDGGPAGGPAIGTFEDLAETVPAVQADLFAQGLGLTGPRLAFTNGCTAASNAIIHACRLLRSGRVDVAVCGGVYLVEEQFFAFFDGGHAFADGEGPHPFSADRSGLLLGDAAAVLVLETAEHVAARRGKAIARIAGWGSASDAHHICRPHPAGAGMVAAMNQAIGRAELSAQQIGYVNAHGTATPANDAAETAAVKQVFGDGTRVPVSSTKGSTGHTLEASGALEAVISLIALEEQAVPPTTGYRKPDPECDLDCVPEGPRPVNLDYVLSLNAAFGGANTALLLARV